MDELDHDYEALGATTGRMRAAVQSSVDQADHLDGMDDADIALAFEMAQVIDDARDSGEEERIHRAWCVAMPSLHKVLTSLGLNPEGRQKLGITTGDDDEDW